MPAVSKAQQRFMGMVRAAQKGEMKNPSPEVADAAASMKKKDAKSFASTKHKGLPEKKEVKEEDTYKQKNKELNKNKIAVRYGYPKPFDKGILLTGCPLKEMKKFFLVFKKIYK